MADDEYDRLVYAIGQQYCGAKRKNGKPCQLRAGLGTDHPGVGACKHHCGSVPSSRTAARRRLAEAAVAFYGLPREVDPHTALLEEVHRAAGHVEWLAERVREIKGPKALLWSEGDEKTPTQVPSVLLLQLYNTERDRLADRAATAIRCGIAERTVRLAEDQGKLMARVITGIFRDLGIDIAEPSVRVAVRKHLALAEGVEVET